MKRADAKGSASVRVPSVPAVNGMSDAQHPIDYDDNPVTNEAEAMAVNDACIPDFERVVNYVIGTISSVPEEQKKLQSLAAEFGKVIEAEDYGIWAAGVTDELIEQERARLISEEETDRMWAKDSEFDELQGQFNRQHKGWVRRERQLAAEAKDSEFDWLAERFRMQDESRRARIRYVNDELRA
ncbi:hypothetical protein HYU12_02600, partial [Candidatus Woesearchaeota archaeon]|nr:hypothetical protein [Candidatus Woesearchaeota archaeon]